MQDNVPHTVAQVAKLISLGWRQTYSDATVRIDAVKTYVM
jgi:hypothetical protein